MNLDGSVDLDTKPHLSLLSGYSVTQRCIIYTAIQLIVAHYTALYTHPLHDPISHARYAALVRHSFTNGIIGNALPVRRLCHELLG